jgi:spermidine/putrescine transport system substrate-binding protein
LNRRLFLMGIPGLAGCTRGRRPRLNVFNWSNYVAPETAPNFEKEYRVRVRYAVYESNEEMLAKVLSGNSGWDIVFPSNYFVRPMQEMGLLAPLRHDQLTNLGHLEARFRSPAWDPELRWSVPYMWSGTGIVYNRKLSPPPSSWASLWEERLKGRLAMLDDAAEVLGACLKKLGFSFNSTNPAQLLRARDEAVSQKRLLRAYLNAEVRDQLVAGDVLAAQLWGTTAQQAIEASGSLAFAYPADGFPLYADNAAILRESRNPELAHRFIDYLLRPEVSAAIAIATRTATANAGAWAMLPDELRGNRTLYPSGRDLERGEWWQTPSPSLQRLRDKLWTEIKSA